MKKEKKKGEVNGTDNCSQNNEGKQIERNTVDEPRHFFLDKLNDNNSLSNQRKDGQSKTFKSCDYLRYKKEPLEKWEKEMERLRSKMRRSNKRNPLPADPHGPSEVFVANDDYIFEKLYLREIKDNLSEKQFEIYTYLKRGYSLLEISDLINISYTTLRRAYKNIKKVVEKVFKEE